MTDPALWEALANGATTDGGQGGKGRRKKKQNEAKRGDGKRETNRALPLSPGNAHVDDEAKTKKGRLGRLVLQRTSFKGVRLGPWPAPGLSPHRLRRKTLLFAQSAAAAGSATHYGHPPTELTPSPMLQESARSFFWFEFFIAPIVSRLHFPVTMPRPPLLTAGWRPTCEI